MGRGPTREYYKVLHKDYVEGTLTCLKPEIIKERINTDFPLVLSLEPTNICDLKCYYCPRQKAKKGQGMMDMGLFRKLIDETVDYNRLIMLNLHKDGESFLHPDFLKMVRHAKDRKAADIIHVNTNAVSWNDEIISAILDSGIDDITVSIDAARPETFMEHKKKDKLRVVEENVLKLLKARKTKGQKKPFLRVKIMEFDKISKEELSEFFDRWQGAADMVQVTGIHNWGDGIKGLRVTDEESSSRYPCALLWYSLVINWNGEATVCSVDWDTQIKVGDARNQTLHEIWNSPEIKRARLAQLKSDFSSYPVCRDCVIWVSVGDLKEWLQSRKEFCV